MRRCDPKAGQELPCSEPSQPNVLLRRKPQVDATLALRYRVVQHLTILGGLPGFPAACQLPDPTLIFEGELLRQWSFQARLRGSEDSRDSGTK